MIEGKEKTTVPIPSVGADGEQPISNFTTSIITADSNEINTESTTCMLNGIIIASFKSNVRPFKLFSC